MSLETQEREKYQDAIDSLEKMMKNHPKNARLHHIIAECYVSLKAKAKAMQVLSDFLKTGIRNSYISEFLDTLRNPE